MRTVYATQLKIGLPPATSAAETADRLTQMTHEWIGRKYDRQWHVTFRPNPGAPQPERPIEQHRCDTRIFRSEGADLVQIDWSHPDDDDPDSIWHSSIVVARAMDVVEFGVVIRIMSAETMILRPLRFALGCPSIVQAVLDEFDASLGEWPLARSVRHLSPAEVERFCEQQLLAPTRTVPIVMVSPDAWTERPVINPEILWKELRGSSDVVLLASKWAALKLTDIIGRERTCANGAVRVYWPPFTLEQNPFWHRLFLPDRVRAASDHGGNLGQQLFRFIASVGSFRFAEGRATRAARAAVAVAERAPMEALRSAVEKGTLEQSKLETQLLVAWDKLDSVGKERDALREELDAQKEAWASVTNFMEDEKPVAADSVAPPSIDSVAAALARAKEELSGPLLFLESAERSASASPYKQPNRVYELFEALHCVTTEWREHDGKLGQRWEDALEALGFPGYSPRISQTTETKFGSEYTFPYKGRKQLFEHHITLGAKQADSCLSVHWYRDDEARVLVIGHCGRHLTNTRT